SFVTCTGSPHRSAFMANNAAHPTETSHNIFQGNIVTHQYLFQVLYPKLAERQMRSERRGAVLFTSSDLSFHIIPGPVHPATKAYIGHLGECLATEAEHFDIDVVSVYPGLTNTLFRKREMDIKLPPIVEKLMQNQEKVAGSALSGLDRVTRVDSEVQVLTFRIIMNLIDANIFIKIVSKIYSSVWKKNKND
ncbi:MAG: hypothetical protein EZS28_026476, partial [Streblomastix strix]